MCLKLRKNEEIILTDSAGKEMRILAQNHTAGQVALFFEGPTEIQLHRIKKKKDDAGLKFFQSKTYAIKQ